MRIDLMTLPSVLKGQLSRHLQLCEEFGIRLVLPCDGTRKVAGCTTRQQVLLEGRTAGGVQAPIQIPITYVPFS
jgi:hypothetical protein